MGGIGFRPVIAQGDLVILARGFDVLAILITEIGELPVDPEGFDAVGSKVDVGASFDVDAFVNGFAVEGIAVLALLLRFVMVEVQIGG